MIFAVSRRFLSLGCASSRYTCANVSKPLMASSEWPNATIRITKGSCVINVPSSQPQDSFVRCRLEGVGGGGSWAPPLVSSVRGHHIRRITTITVVICIMRRALPLDSGTPLILPHQKYAVTATLKKTENAFGSVRQLW